MQCFAEIITYISKMRCCIVAFRALVWKALDYWQSLCGGSLYLPVLLRHAFDKLAWGSYLFVYGFRNR